LLKEFFQTGPSAQALNVTDIKYSYSTSINFPTWSDSRECFGQSIPWHRGVERYCSQHGFFRPACRKGWDRTKITNVMLCDKLYFTSKLIFL